MGRKIRLVAGGIAAVLLIGFLTIWAFSKHGGGEKRAAASAAPAPARTPGLVVADPVISPPAGQYGGRQIVTIFDSTPNAEIHFTLNGAAPSKASPIYTQPIGDVTDETTVKAIAFANGLNPSNVVTSSYRFGENAEQQSKDAAASVFELAKTDYGHRQYGAARALFSRGCDGGRSDACNYLGYLYAQGLGGPRDLDKARNVYEYACAHANPASCASLGAIYRDAGDNAKAEMYLKQACDGGLAEGCNLLHSLQ